MALLNKSEIQSAKPLGNKTVAFKKLAYRRSQLKLTCAANLSGCEYIWPIAFEYSTEELAQFDLPATGRLNGMAVHVRVDRASWL